MKNDTMDKAIRNVDIAIRLVQVACLLSVVALGRLVWSLFDAS